MVIILCLINGLTAKKKTTRIIDQMIQENCIAGKYWRIFDIHDTWIEVTKYQRIIQIEYAVPKGTYIGDSVSFIAKRKTRDAVLWYPQSIHFHGKSIFKFGISFIAIAIVIYMSLRYFIFDRETLSINVNPGKLRNASCQMD